MTLHQTLKAIRENGGTVYEIDAVLQHWNFEGRDDLLLQALQSEQLQKIFREFKLIN